MLPGMFEKFDFVEISDHLLHIQKRPTETIVFYVLAAFLRGVDPSKKMRDVRTIHFHPFSRRELRHASENLIFRR